MVLPKNIPILQASNSKNYTCPDNIFCKALIQKHFTRCSTAPELRPPCTNHLPIHCTIDLPPTPSVPPPRHNYCGTDWAEFAELLQAKLATLPPPECITTKAIFKQWLEGLMKVIVETIDTMVPTSQPSPYMKQWWSPDLSKARAEMRKAGRLLFRLCADEHHPIHTEYHQLRKHY
ncbi:hypothetical protein K439DRAFT_1317937, partial [Ramaria rubella]